MQPKSQSLFGLFLTPRHRYSGSIDPMRARVTLAFATFSIVAGLLIGSITLLFLRNTSFAAGLVAGVFFAGILPGVIEMALVHTGYLRAAIILAYLGLLGACIAALDDGLASNSLLVLTIPMLFAGLVWELRGALLTLILETIMILVGASLQ